MLSVWKWSCISFLGHVMFLQLAMMLVFSDDIVYPSASTCAIQLTLPTRYSSYDTFKKALDTGFLMHGGFGLS